MIKITDSDLIEKMARVEGKEWLEHKKNFGEVSPEAVLAEYTRVTGEGRLQGSESDHPITYYGGKGTIYGFGGWNRYFVLCSGEVVFSRSHAGKERVVKEAEATGFRIWG